MRELRHRSIRPRAALCIHVADGLPPAEVNAHQLALAILNLALNARDAMPAGG
jgi:signal transduction histidine kinase